MHAVIYKNDGIGDLAHSLDAINNIISSKDNDKVTIYLSNLCKNFTFLIQNPKVNIKIINNNLNISEKFNLFFYLKKNKINKVYILTPKYFYYFLPLFFRSIKFYAICINNTGNYRRPNTFLRKFLYKYEINDRGKVFKRDSTRLLQYKLCLFNMYFQICPIIYSCLYINEKNCMPQFSEMIGFYFLFFTFSFYGLASIYIKKDEDLIQSIDRI